MLFAVEASIILTHSPKNVNNDKYIGVAGNDTHRDLYDLAFPAPPVGLLTGKFDRPTQTTALHPKPLLLSFDFTILAPPPSTGDNFTVYTTAPSKRMRALLSQQPGFVIDQTFVQNFTIQPRNSKPVDFTPVNGTVLLNAIVFIMSAGGIGPSISVSDFKGLWFNANSKLYPAETWGANFMKGPGACKNCTMENYINNCSYGKVHMSTDNSVVADLTGVSMPLSGLSESPPNLCRPLLF